MVAGRHTEEGLATYPITTLKIGKFLLLVFGLIIRHWARRGKPAHRKVAKVGVWECEVLLVVRHATGLLAT